MKIAFAQTSNVKRFLAGITNVERRGASEASWLVATGEPGLGKTKTLHWFSIQQDGVYVRAKANWRPRWMLQEIAVELGLAPEPRIGALFGQVLGALGTSGRPLVIDEARHMLHDAKLLETVRDLSDLTEVTVILGGEDFVLGKLRSRHPQIASRISEVVQFAKATPADVRVYFDALCDVSVDDDVVAEVLRQSDGYAREIKNAIAVVEQAGKRAGGKTVALADLKGAPLCRSARRLNATPALKVA